MLSPLLWKAWWGFWSCWNRFAGNRGIGGDFHLLRGFFGKYGMFQRESQQSSTFQINSDCQIGKTQRCGFCRRVKMFELLFYQNQISGKSWHYRKHNILQAMVCFIDIPGQNVSECKSTRCRSREICVAVWLCCITYLSGLFDCREILRNLNTGGNCSFKILCRIFQRRGMQILGGDEIEA